MQNLRVIGISGKARSGKDEITNILTEVFGFKKIAFAFHVKELGMKYFGLEEEECYGTKTKESRQILQALGESVRTDCKIIKEMMFANTDWVEWIAEHRFGIPPAEFVSRKKFVKNVLNGIREMYSQNITAFTKSEPNQYWVDTVFSRITDDLVWVIPDVRYKSEYDFIKSMGGKLIRVTRTDNPEIEHGQDHISEVDLDLVTDWDFQILNTHDKNWKPILSVNCSNMVRKLHSEKFFTPEDINRFRIKISNEL